MVVQSGEPDVVLSAVGALGGVFEVKGDKVGETPKLNAYETVRAMLDDDDVSGKVELRPFR